MNITDTKLSVQIEYFVDIPETRVVLKSFKFPNKTYCPFSNKMHFVLSSTLRRTDGNIEKLIDYHLNVCKSSKSVKANKFMSAALENFASQLKGPSQCPFRKVL
jgi:hypothetical protein